jgi:hypothetical protein
MVPIIPGGNSIPLTFSNRKEYVERAIEYRLHEMDRQVRWEIREDAHGCLGLCSDEGWPVTTELIYLYLNFRPYSETCQAMFLGLLSPYSRLYSSSELIIDYIKAKLSPWCPDFVFSVMLVHISYYFPTQCSNSSWVSQPPIPGFECLFFFPSPAAAL